MDETLQPTVRHLDRETIRRYSEVSHDPNPLHLDPVAAAKSPFGGIIAQGTMSVNLIWQSARRTLGEDALEGAAITIRFRKPVRENETITAGGQRGGERTTGAPVVYDVWAKNSAGEVVLSGVLTLRGRAA